MRLRLIGLVERLNGDAERQCAAALLIDARQQASEAVMAMDWLGKLSTAQHQSEAIIQLLDMLNALFAPQELFYVPVENGPVSYTHLDVYKRQVLDYGRRTVDELVSQVRDDRVDIVLISTLMLPSALRVREVVTQLRQESPLTRVGGDGVCLINTSR